MNWFSQLFNKRRANSPSKERVVFASDVSGERDGIGLEVYQNGQLAIEIFRDDTRKTRTVTLYQSVSLELLERSIEQFKREIGDFIDFSIYRFTCVDIEVGEQQISLAAEPFPLEQNCDYVEISLHFPPNSELKFWYDDGTKLACYSSAFQNMLVDEQHLIIRLYLFPEHLDKDDKPVNFEQIEIAFKDKALWQKVRAVLGK